MFCTAEAAGWTLSLPPEARYKTSLYSMLRGDGQSEGLPTSEGLPAGFHEGGLNFPWAVKLAISRNWHRSKSKREDPLLMWPRGFSGQRWYSSTYGMPAKPLPHRPLSHRTRSHGGLSPHATCMGRLDRAGTKGRERPAPVCIRRATEGWRPRTRNAKRIASRADW
jgi:hypothetical protein